MQGVYFGFHGAKGSRVHQIKAMVQDEFEDLTEKMGNIEIFQDGASESTFPARPGVRLYFAEVFVNEKLVLSQDIKY